MNYTPAFYPEKNKNTKIETGQRSDSS